MRLFILLSVGACMLISNNTWACAECGQVSKYGTGVIKNTGKLTKDIAQTTSDLGQKYAKTTQVLTKTGNDIVSAIQANSASISAEQEKNRIIESKLLTELNAQTERISKTAYLAQMNMEIAKTHGAQNVPARTCDDYLSAKQAPITQQYINDVERELIALRIEDRKSENRDVGISPFILDSVSLEAESFTKEEAKLAVKKIQILTGEAAFPISPDRIAIELANDKLDPSMQQLMASYIRSSQATDIMTDQVLNKTKDSNGDPDSLSFEQDINQKVEEGLSVERITQESAASETMLLRSISRDQALNNKIKLEQLHNLLMLNKLSAALSGFASEEALKVIGGQMEDAIIKSRVTK